MKSKILAIITASLAVVLLALLTIIALLPSSTAYSILCSGSEGHSRLYENTKPVILLSYSDLESLPPNRTVLVAAVTREWGVQQALYLKHYLENGGTAIIYGNPNILGRNLVLLGINVSVESTTIYDQVLSYRNRLYPRVELPKYNTSIYVYKPFVIKGDLDPVGYTSIFSYADLNGNGHYDLGEPIDSFPVAFEARVGLGKVLIVSAPRVFTNDLFDLNKDLLHVLSNNKTLVLDQVSIDNTVVDYIRMYWLKQKYDYIITGFLVLVAGVIAYLASKYL